MKIQIKDGKTYAPLSELKLWDKNPREITEKDFERLKKQIQKLNVYKPLLVNQEGIVLGGNMRLRAFQEMGMAEVWVSIVETKSEAQMLEYALSDNDRSGAYNDQALAELIQLNGVDIDLEMYKVDLGKTIDLRGVLEQFGPGPEEVEAPAVEEVAVSKLGEIYQLGKNRLMCGDSTKKEDVEKLMGGEKVDVVFTDPPYRLSSDTFGLNRNRKYKSVDSDRVPEFDDWLRNIPPVAKDKFSIFVWESWRNTIDLWQSLQKYWSVKNLIIWHATNRMHKFSHGYFFNKYDICLFASGKESTFRKDVVRGDNFVGDLVEAPVSNDIESGQSDVFGVKPIKIIAPLLNATSEKENIILDLFGGSGSTLVACEQLGRVCYMIELSPNYTDVIRKRYARTIGQEDQWEEITPVISAS